MTSAPSEARDPVPPRARPGPSLSRICEATALGLALLGTAVVVEYLRQARATHPLDPVDLEISDLVAPLESSSEEVAQWNAIVSLGARRDQARHLASRLAYLYVGRERTPSGDAIVRALRGLGDGVLPPLFDLLCAGTPELQEAACSLLMQWGLGPEHRVYAPDGLERMWIGASPILGFGVCQLVCDVDARELARVAAQDPHPRVRTYAMIALGGLAEPDDEPLLKRARTDHDPLVRTFAGWALNGLWARQYPYQGQAGDYMWRLARREIAPLARREIARISGGFDRWSAMAFDRPARLESLIGRLATARESEIAPLAIALADMGPGPNAAVDALRACLAPREREDRTYLSGRFRVAYSDPPRAFRHLFEQDERPTDVWGNLLAGLGHRDERALVLLALGEIGDPRRMPALVAPPPDPTPLQRIAALYAWTHHDRDDPGTIATLAALLDDPELGELAALSLGKIGAPALPAVRDWLSRRAPDERVAGAVALWRMGGIAADDVPVLQLLVESEDSRTQVFAMRALAALGMRALSAIPALVAAIGDPAGVPDDEPAEDPSDDRAPERIFVRLFEPRCPIAEDDHSTVAAEAIATLCQVGTPGLRAVVAELDRHSPGVRHRIAAVLRARGDLARAIVPDLMARFSSDTPETRAEICGILGAMSGAAGVTVPFLVSALQDSETSVRVAAARALGELGPCAAAAKDVLRALLGDVDLAVVEPAVEALMRIEAPATARVALLFEELAKHAPDARDLEARPFVARRGWPWHCAMRALSRFDSADRPAVIAGLGDARPAVRRAVVEALFRMPGDVHTALTAAALDPALAPAAGEVIDLRRSLHGTLPRGLHNQSGPTLVTRRPQYLVLYLEHLGNPPVR